MSFQAEMLAPDPLTQERADEVDCMCGVEMSDDLLTTAAGPSNEHFEIEDYGESILAQLEFDNSDDRLSDDELVSDEDRP